MNESSLPRGLLLAAVLLSLTGVLAGTFGAHVLDTRVEPGLLSAFEIGVRYQLYHAIAVLVVAGLYGRYSGRTLALAGWLMTVGVIVFSGSLYAMAVSGQRWLGAVTPIGGLGFLAGWAAMVVYAVRLPGARRSVRVGGAAACVAALVVAGKGCAAGRVAPTPAAPDRTTAERPSAVPGPSVDEWFVFRPPDLELEVQLPVQPTASVIQVDTPIGTHPVRRYTAVVEGMEIEAGALERPNDPLAALIGEAAVLDLSCRGLAKRLGGRVADARVMTTDGHRGREFEIDFSRARVTMPETTARMIMTDRFIYHLFVVQDDPSVDPNAARSCLESFRIVEPPAGEIATGS